MPITAAATITSGNGAPSTSAMNAAIAIQSAMLAFRARLPTLNSASATSATTAHLTPSNAAAASGTSP